MLDAVSAELHARTQDATVVRYEGQQRYIRKLKAFDLEDEPAPSSSVVACGKTASISSREAPAGWA